MQATKQPWVPDDSLSDYPKCWSKLIDRGGLYHIDDKVYDLIEIIEIIFRKHINHHSMSSYTPGSNLTAPIIDEILSSPAVLLSWDNIADSIPSKYEVYSMELLKSIIGLWISIRGHSFASDFTRTFEEKSKSKQALRKSLKQTAEK